eukprot:gnl/TRDRNA2_/TRDRNA2_166168_c0_seq1.p1 gnl/TRDRNA2_/TRDRNA2_166168_c0~~gnl/TRDRNA2_/TRDRNA2_166168_c0_seq1.p1  ORF type:complete len:439 (-),score=55.92 gnl/TRDRNA2_/TRDRNA2_166168_c0_seq1:18-1277(-)
MVASAEGGGCGACIALRVWKHAAQGSDKTMLCQSGSFREFLDIVGLGASTALQQLCANGLSDDVLDDCAPDCGSVAASLPPRRGSVYRERLHVVYGITREFVQGALASAASVAIHCAERSRLAFHFLAAAGVGGAAATLTSQLGLEEGWDGTGGPTPRVAGYSQILLGAWAEVIAVPSERISFSRFDLMPALFHKEQDSIALWLDADTIVRADVAILHQQLFESGKAVLLAARGPEGAYSLRMFLNGNAPLLRWAPLDHEAHNAGIFALDPGRWRAQRLTSRVARWSAAPASYGKLWHGETQVPLLLALFAHYPSPEEEELFLAPAAWNRCGLGHSTSSQGLSSANALHWTGPHKPWLQNGLHRVWWQPYTVPGGAALVCAAPGAPAACAAWGVPLAPAHTAIERDGASDAAQNPGSWL